MTTSVRQPPQALTDFKGQKSGHCEGRTGHTSPCAFDHREWCERAWTAILRSLERCTLKFDPEEEHENFLNRFEQRSKCGTAIKWLKFHTTYVFGFAMNQTELPVAPGEMEPGEHAGRPVGGCLGRVLKAIMYRGKAGNKNYQRWAYDVMMSKIGFPPAPESFVKAALEDHKRALTQRTRSEDSLENQTILSTVQNKIDKICDALFNGVKFEHMDPIPSLRASIERGLKDGGALGQLLGEFQLRRRFPGDGEEMLTPLVEPEVLYGMTWTPSKGVQEVRFVPAYDLVSQFQDFVDEQWISRINQPLEAQPCPILEPLKVRTITKGQAAEYYRTIEIQKMMHSRLRHHPVFEFIGHPIDDASFAKAFGTKSDLKDDEFYVSGDYKAATDNLNPLLSEYCWWAIAWRVRVMWQGQVVPLVDTPYAKLGLKALVHHRLFYEKHDMTKTQLHEALLKAKSHEEAEALQFEICDQTWGQLMGSPMSFPILCLVNAAATLAALDLPFSRSLPMRVNGDDIGFIANAESYALWKKVTNICGLEFSLGKNYTSRDFLIMNSEFRRAPESGEDTDVIPSGYIEDSGTAYGYVMTYNFIKRPKTWRLEGFLNQSILYHTVRKGMDAGEQKDVYWTDLEDLSKDVLRGIRAKDQWKVLSIFLREHSHVLRELPPECNLWFPRSLGGAGVAVPATETVEELCARHDRGHEVLKKQRKLAAYLACYPAKRFQLIRTPSLKVGYVDEVFSDLTLLSEGQAQSKLVKSTRLFWGQRPALGGETLLGYVIRQLGDYFMEPQEVDDHEMDHRGSAIRINKRYAEWTFGFQAASLKPSKICNIIDFEEGYHVQTYLESLNECPSRRSLDQSFPLDRRGVVRELGLMKADD